MFSGTAESRMRRMKAKRKSMPIWGNFAVVPSAWFASPGFIEMGTVEVGGANEVIPFLEVPKTCRETISSENLPSEFFSHQLMEVDSNNYEEVISFSRKWGLLSSPLRGAIETHQLEHTRAVMGESSGISLEMLDGSLRGIKLTDAANLQTDSIFAISVLEIIWSIRLLQLMSYNIQLTAKGEPFLFDWVLNTSYRQTETAVPICDAGTEYLAARQIDRPLFTDAIIAQMIETLSDHAPWRECACKGCGKMFKHKQGAKNPHRDSSYCCKKCEERQRKRNQREAARNRIDHGI